MRILVAHSFYRLAGGEDRYVRELVRILDGAHEVRLLERSNDDLDPGLPAAARMTYSRSERERVESAIDSFSPDVVHLHNAYPALGPAVHLAAADAGVPLVMTVHNQRLRCPNGLMFTQGSPCSRCTNGAYFNAALHRCLATPAQSAAYGAALWTHRFVMHLERRVGVFVAPSEFMRSRLASWGIHNVALARNFAAPVPAAPSAPGKYGLFAGRLSHEKGLDVLLHALRIAGDPPFRIAGTGPDAGKLRALASSLALEQTQFLAHVDPADMPALMTGARYVAMPSVCEENAPLAALEALAAGRPILVSDRGGLPELAGGGRGWITRAGDPEALAGAIMATSEAAACASAGAAALAFARDELTEDKHLRALEGAYSTAAAR